MFLIVGIADKLDFKLANLERYGEERYAIRKLVLYTSSYLCIFKSSRTAKLAYNELLLFIFLANTLILVAKLLVFNDLEKMR